MRRLSRLGRGRKQSPAPVLSVVMPVYNVAAYLPECLDSVLAQDLGDLGTLEIVAVDDGSTDSCPEILADYAGRDPRVRVLRQPNAGQGAARNLGVQHARGEFLTFVDSDDTIPARAFRRMVRMLRQSDSDFCVGRTRRLSEGELTAIGWSQLTHDRDRVGITVDDFPLVLRDVLAGNRVIRRQFWLDHAPDFQPGIAYEDHVPMLMAYVRARRFDVIAASTYNWRKREDGTSTGQAKARIANLRDRVTVKEHAQELLRAEASERVYDAWVARCIGTDFFPFVRLVLEVGADDEYKGLLSDTYRRFLGRATPAALESIGPRPKVVGWLVAEGRWDDAARTLELLSAPGRERRTVVSGQHIRLLRPPGLADLDVPEHLWQLAAPEVRVMAGFDHSRTTDAGSLEVVGTVTLRGPEVEPGQLRISAAVVDVATGETRAAPARLAGGAYVLDAPVAALSPGRWAVEITLALESVSRTDRILKVDKPALAAAAAAADEEHAPVVPRWDPAEGLVLEVKPDRSRSSHP